VRINVDLPVNSTIFLYGLNDTRTADTALPVLSNGVLNPTAEWIQIGGVLKLTVSCHGSNNGVGSPCMPDNVDGSTLVLISGLLYVFSFQLDNHCHAQPSANVTIQAILPNGFVLQRAPMTSECYCNSSDVNEYCLPPQYTPPLITVIMPMDFKTATNFGVIASSAVTNTGSSTVNGDLGNYPGTAVPTFPPGTVTGDVHAADTIVKKAKEDVAEAVLEVNQRIANALTVNCVTDLGGVVQLGGRTLTPGFYSASSSMEVTSGELYLHGGVDAVFVFFKMATTLVTTTDRTIILSGGVQPKDIFWIVGTAATLGVGSTWSGSIVAGTAVTLATGATLNGR